MYICLLPNPLSGTLNFDLVPEDQVHEIVCQGLEADDAVSEVESDEALTKLQVVLLDAMQNYWVPRFILHFKQTACKETMEVLTRPVPGDLECLSQERRLRCRFMFPTLAQVQLTWVNWIIDDIGSVIYWFC